jgi:iron complex transport system ATP-binding protein
MILEARAIEVAYGAKKVLRRVDFSARAGAVTVIVGPNGSGKTTLLRAISGDVAHSGTVCMNGRDTSRMKPWERAAERAVLPQSTSLAFPFTVREIVRLGLTGGYSGLDGPDLQYLPERALERVELSGFEGRYYQELSGGEQQRVQMARVLCQVWVPVVDGRPRWLLLDEPVSSLDIRHQLVIMGIARDFAEGGGGVVAVLHDLNLAAIYADRIVMMNAGVAVAAGTPAETLRDEIVERVFDCPLRVGRLPAPGTPFVLPQTALSGD